MYWKGPPEHAELSGVIFLLFLIRTWKGNERREDPGALGSGFLLVFMSEKADSSHRSHRGAAVPLRSPKGSPKRPPKQDFPVRQALRISKTSLYGHAHKPLRLTKMVASI